MLLQPGDAEDGLVNTITAQAAVTEDLVRLHRPPVRTPPPRHRTSPMSLRNCRSLRPENSPIQPDAHTDSTHTKPPAPPVASRGNKVSETARMRATFRRLTHEHPSFNFGSNYRLANLHSSLNRVRRSTQDPCSQTYPHRETSMLQQQQEAPGFQGRGRKICQHSPRIRQRGGMDLEYHRKTAKVCDVPKGSRSSGRNLAESPRRPYRLQAKGGLERSLRKTLPEEPFKGPRHVCRFI